MRASEHDHIGTRIAAARLKAGLSQSTLARKSGVNRYTILAIEHGNFRMLGADKLFAIADALRVSARALLGNDAVGKEARG